MSYRFLIVGAGFSGSVLARELVTNIDCRVDIWEQRNHLAGNCYTYQDEKTGITVHGYGPHIFNTAKQEVWDYFNRFSPLRPYTHKVVAVHGSKTFTLPINLTTLKEFFGREFTPESAKQLLNKLADKSIKNPQNFEEQALSIVGKDLYHTFFYGYTRKQWGCEPRLLPASIFNRLPLRLTNDDNYHNHQLTGIPENGYTDFVVNLLNHPKISFQLNRSFSPSADDISNYDHIFYTGAIDAYFNYEFGRLSYRTLIFEKETLPGDFQQTAQTNFCDESVPYTRITEHKHFMPWKRFDDTVIFREYSAEAGIDDIPYYPKRLPDDMARYEKYRRKAEQLPDITFLGRLGTYRYLDMQHVIAEAIDLAKEFEHSLQRKG